VAGLIAATALVRDLTLVTRNTKDFAELGLSSSIRGVLIMNSDFLHPADAAQQDGGICLRRIHPDMLL
jgi:hypothetical protein